MDRFITNGVEIAFSDYRPAADEKNPPILLIHGFASTQSVNWLFTQWIKTLTEDGRRVVTFDNRGHGQSTKLYDPALYSLEAMAGDASALLDHLGVPRADVMGYSMGARIAAMLTLIHPEKVRSLILGGVGEYLVTGPGLPSGLADAMEADRIEDIGSPMMKIFRGFAESTRSDLKALAACARGFGRTLEPATLSRIAQPTLICVGTRDDVAGDPQPLQPLFQRAEFVDIPGRDHNRAVGDRVYKQAVLSFLATQDATWRAGG